jgi:hypothetical protein
VQFGLYTSCLTHPPIQPLSNAGSLIYCRSSVRHDLNYIKWILLVFVIMEIVSLLVAFIMRCCVDPDGHYGDFADEEVRFQEDVTVDVTAIWPCCGCSGLL